MVDGAVTLEQLAWVKISLEPRMSEKCCFNICCLRNVASSKDNLQLFVWMRLVSANIVGANVVRTNISNNCFYKNDIRTNVVRTNIVRTNVVRTNVVRTNVVRTNVCQNKY